ncbi:MAG TPA: hypothetical protein VE861_10055, partial [Gemmatimonadaceae bacterium]|nr:hypothetical protein [Gemmatimonadaceae bacterium]
AKGLNDSARTLQLLNCETAKLPDTERNSRRTEQPLNCNGIIGGAVRVSVRDSSAVPGAVIDDAT